MEQNPFGDPNSSTNANGTPNKGGIVDRFTDLEVATGGSTHTLRFYIADMGKDQMVLGYPWFVAANPQPNWAQGTLSAALVIKTAGAAAEPAPKETPVTGLKTITVRNRPWLRKGEKIELEWAKTMIAQQLVEQAHDKTK